MRIWKDTSLAAWALEGHVTEKMRLLKDTSLAA